MTTFYKGPPILLPAVIGIIVGAVLAPAIAEKLDGRVAVWTAFGAIILLFVAVTWVGDWISKRKRRKQAVDGVRVKGQSK